MPHLIKSLGNIEECSGAVLLGIKGCVDALDQTVGLVNCGMSFPESELKIGDETV
jgi:hypothetical protein